MFDDSGNSLLRSSHECYPQLRLASCRTYSAPPWHWSKIQKALWNPGALGVLTGVLLHLANALFGIFILQGLLSRLIFCFYEHIRPKCLTRFQLDPGPLYCLSTESTLCPSQTLLRLSRAGLWSNSMAATSNQCDKRQRTLSPVLYYQMIELRHIYKILRKLKA